MKKYIVVLLLIIYSCNNDSEPDVPVHNVVQPTISSLSTNFIIEGEYMTIYGSNFIDTEFDTKLLINNISFDVTPISDNEIEIQISNLLGIENSSVSVKVSNKISNESDFFIVPRGWYEINGIDKEIVKAYLFDDSNEITFLYDEMVSPSSYYGVVSKIKTNENGYYSTFLDIPGGNKNDLNMFTSEIGVTNNSSSGFFTVNSFTNTNQFGDFYGSGEITAEVEIVYVENQSSVIWNCCGANIYTDDNGLTYDTTNSSQELYSDNNRFRSRFYGKGSDNYYYQLGMDVALFPTTTEYVIKSTNGFDNWEIVIDNTSLYFGLAPYFYDYDMIFSISSENKLILSTDFCATWSNQKDNVQNFFIKNRTNWFVISDNKLLSTTDSGMTWNLELEFPVGSEINHMFFSENKTILSGNNILYVKHN